MSLTKNSSSTSTRSCAPPFARDDRQRVAFAGVRAQALVHLAHEAVEMGAAFFADRQAGEEQVDQEGLAAADAAPQVQAARRRRASLPNSWPSQPAARRVEQAGVDAVEFVQRGVLRRIVLPFAAGDAVAHRLATVASPRPFQRMRAAAGR